MKMGDVVIYQGEEYEIVWVYNDSNLEIRSIKKSGLPVIIPVHISEVILTD